MTKLIVVCGVTGNQGGSVARRFLQDKNYRVRGLTRNPESPTAQKLAAEGVEVVAAELDDVQTLLSAFKGANLIFSVTNYWEPFFRPDCRAKAADAGISCRKYAYDTEYAQGRNIADAASATVNTLDDNGLIASTLSHAGKCSNGKFKELYHFDAKADVFPFYVQEKHPKLAAKLSCMQTGYFTSSYKLAPDAYLKKMDDETFQMSFPMHPDKKTPHLEVNLDTGPFAYAISQLPPGKSYMAAGTNCSWREYMRLWSEATGVPSSYRECTMEEFVKLAPDEAFGWEAGDMFAYSSEPGYDGADASLLWAADIGKMGVECLMTSLEKYHRTHDWSAVLGKPYRVSAWLESAVKGTTTV